MITSTRRPKRAYKRGRSTIVVARKRASGWEMRVRLPGRSFVATTTRKATATATAKPKGERKREFNRVAASLRAPSLPRAALPADWLAGWLARAALRGRRQANAKGREGAAGIEPWRPTASAGGHWAAAWPPSGALWPKARMLGRDTLNQQRRLSGSRIYWRCLLLLVSLGRPCSPVFARVRRNCSLCLAWRQTLLACRRAG